MYSLMKSVGIGGVNFPRDVVEVQTLLKKRNFDPKGIDGRCGSNTIHAIKKFQSHFMRIPDGRVDPNGATWKRLTGAIRLEPNVIAAVGVQAYQKINSAGLQIVKDLEGLYLTSYKCPAGIWTIGYGHTGNVISGMTITEGQADAYLRQDIMSAEKSVARLVKVPLTDNQFSALVSFTFNVGEGNLQSSTLLKKLNVTDYNGASDEFLKWDKGGGKILPGLVTRRNKERALFLK